MNRGQEASTVWAVGPRILEAPSSFLAPWELPDPGVPLQPPPGICLPSRGEPGPPAKPPAQAGALRAPPTTRSCSGPRPDPRWGNQGPLSGRGGALQRLPESGVSREVPSCLCPPLHGLEGHGPLSKPTQQSLRGSGPSSMGAQVGTEQTGLFDQRFRPMPGCGDSGQWPNRPRRMPSGPRQECHSCPWRVVTAGGAPGSRGDARPGGCPGNSGHLPTARGGRERTGRSA